MAAVVNGEEFESKRLKISEGLELECDVPEGDSEIYLVVSGMSVMPLTVRFERK